MYELYEKLLIEHGITSMDVARQTGISPQILSNWKRRGGNLSYKNIQKLAAFFGLSEGYFMESVGIVQGVPTEGLTYDALKVARAYQDASPEMQQAINTILGIKRASASSKEA